MEDLVSHPDAEGRPKDTEASIEWSVAAEALDQMERNEMRELMLRVLDELPDSQRIVFVLKDLEDWGTDEIASRLNVTPALVRQRLHRARLYLQDRLRSHVSGRRPCF